MRVTFLTGSLEPDKDGVGDYTRWLAIEAARRGVQCRLVALGDRHLTSPVSDRTASGIPVLRLPFAMPWPARLRAAREFMQSAPSGPSTLNEDQIAERGARMARRDDREYREYLREEQRRQPGCPAREVVLDQRGQATDDWVSLQFVPYSFQRWGLTARLVRDLPQLVGPARLHVMLHEIWIDGRESWRRELVSRLQRRTIVKLCRGATLVHTSNGTYQQVLGREGVRAEMLPLFGSMPIVSSGAASWLVPALSAAGCDGLSHRREDWWLFAFFGALHPIWPPEPLLSHLEAAAAAAHKKVALIAIGRLGPGEALWADMAARCGSRMTMLRLGEQPARRVSELLNTVDFGIATTPLALIGKSATVAAMFDHGLPVVVNREDGRWQAPPASDGRESALLIRMGPDAVDFAVRLRRAERRPPSWRLPEIADRWCEDLGRVRVQVA